ncbi:hypothetical protein BKK81_22695 [Cupriavidus sp. USMAHM13]|uniref:acyl-CoA dehydrogenase family protein n=1 Tax=Cupriavidus sp. USMAHM13 TaxID=1389192 RepID=UPI0008A67E63|nr:acyl-CoA dehydrogenase family protein [Cupriavidus sp. USMAHM13]AOZ02125.1 hypothetical protein BKK81_22695 [Cupriavidus sp. USMAHM13]
MDPKAIAFGEAIETALGNPYEACSAISFQSVLELDEQEAFPQRNLERLRELGCFEQLIPESLGGRLGELEQAMLMARLVSRRDLTTAIAFGQAFLGSIPIWLGGSAEQRQQAAALLRDGGLACLALTEREHGSDILSTGFRVRAGGSGLVADGSKWLINNARRGASLTVLCRIEQGDGSAGLGLLWLRRPSGELPSSWRPLSKIRTHGIRGADISGLQLEAHHCESGALLPCPEGALPTVLKTLQISRVLCTGFSLGAVDTMFRLTLRFARARRLYGKLAIEIPMVRARLARCYVGILVGDLVAQVACRAISARPAELSVLSAVAKFHVPSEAEAIARELALVLGARHYVRSEFPWGVFEKQMRDNQVVSLFDGSTQVNLSLISAQLRALSMRLRERLEAGPGPGWLDKAATLLWRDGSCQGWPAQADLRLGASGEDCLLPAFFALRRTHGEVPPAVAVALDALEGAVRRWLVDCQVAMAHATPAHDAVDLMQLSERYAALLACACAALAWHLHREASPGYRLDETVLLIYVAGKLPEAGIVVTEAQRQSIVDAAMALVDGQRLLSLSDIRIRDAQ